MFKLGMVDGPPITIGHLPFAFLFGFGVLLMPANSRLLALFSSGRRLISGFWQAEKHSLAEAPFGQRNVLPFE
ncbi:MAG: hypothetical protein ACTH8P_08820 [Ewingella sp.]|uniref:hypothetical protein n=1 Tax=Ewingella TaxID=41201 RepID=UPI0033657BF1